MSAGGALQTVIASALNSMSDLSGVFDGPPARAIYPYAAIDATTEIVAGPRPIPRRAMFSIKSFRPCAGMVSSKCKKYSKHKVLPHSTSAIEAFLQQPRSIPTLRGPRRSHNVRPSSISERM
jgi:hypothetical protein